MQVHILFIKKNQTLKLTDNKLYMYASISLCMIMTFNQMISQQYIELFK